MSESRREFLYTAAAGLAASAKAAGTLPRRKLGQTGLEVSVIGLGGARVGQLNDGKQAEKVIKRCYDLGVNYFDTAAAGAYGLSQKRYGLALAGIRDKIVIGTKTRHRTAEHSLVDLNQSLGQMKTDYLDLYQIHNVISEDDVDFIFGPKGVMEMVEKARRDGKIRFVGVTGHTTPAAINKALDQYDFDTVLVPLSVTDGANKQKSFERETLPLAKEKGMGVLAMKSLGAGALLREGKVGVEEALRYVLSLPISTLIMGCDQVEQVETDIRIAKTAGTMTGREKQALLGRVRRFNLARLEPWKQPADPLTGDRRYHGD